MFKLFKARNFSDYINDTFSFFKIEGKNFFKNFFIINSGFLVLLIVLTYFIFDYFSLGLSNNYKETMQNDDGFSFILIIICILAFLSFVIVSTICFSYPTLYLKNMEKYPGQEITSKMIFTDLKEQSVRILLFMLGFTFIILPIATIFLGISFLLIFLLIGIPLLLILTPIFISWTSLSYNEYLIKKTPFIDSLKKGFKMLRSNFWPIIGSTIIIYIITQMVLTIFTVIPQMIVLFKPLISTDIPNSNESFIDSIFLTYIITYSLSILISLILNNLVLINQGLIYYSEIEKTESVTTRIDIEQIGKTDE